MISVKSAAKSVMIIMLFTLISKFLGFLREVLIASKFGSGAETDAYFIALTASYVIMTVIGESINTTLIPIFSDIEFKHGRKTQNEYVSNLITIVFILTCVFAIAGYTLAPYIVKFLAKGFIGEQYHLTITLARIGFPMMIFIALTNIFTSYLQYNGDFTIPSFSGIPFNFIYIIFLLLFAATFGIRGLMIATIFATFVQLMIHIPFIKKYDFKYKLKLDIKDIYIKQTLFLMAPVIIGSISTQLNLIIDRTLASELAIGSISALNYANKLNTLVFGVFIISITTVLFPLLSKESTKNDLSDFKKIINYGINTIIFITVPVTVGLIVLAFPVVRLFFQRGAFDGTATTMTALSLIYYSIGLLGMGIRDILNKVYYSIKDTRTPMINGIIAVVINVILNLMLIKYMAHSGLALATSIAVITSAILLLIGLRKKIGDFGLSNIMSCFIKVCAASAIMGVIVYNVYNTMLTKVANTKIMELILLVCIILIGAVIYLTFCYIFRVKEINLIIRKLNKLSK